MHRRQPNAKEHRTDHDRNPHVGSGQLPKGREFAACWILN